MIDLYASKPSKFDGIKRWFLKHTKFLQNRNSLFYYGCLLLLFSFGFYFLMIILNNFTSPWSGDYVLQYIPFAFNYYDDWWNFFKTGVFPHWDMNVFLGADTVTSDGYYIMFSPFFWPMLFTPRSWIPHTLVVISMLRFMLAGLFFRMYLKKMDCNEKFARIGGLVYAFSGFAVFFIWFNNFLDIAVLFPLVLLGIEKVLKDKKPWLLAVALGITGIDNFFFFPAIVIMTFVYSMFRFFQMCIKNTWKDNLLVLGTGFVGYVLAIGIGGCMLLPGLATSMSDPKIEGGKYINLLIEAFKGHDFKTAAGLLFDWSKVPDGSEYWNGIPLIEIFIPPATCRHNSLLNFAEGNTFDNNAASFWSGLTLLMFFFPALIDSIKRKKISHILAIALVTLCVFTPFSYFLLFGGSKAYSRWVIIVPALIISYECQYLSRNPKISVKMLTLGFAFVVTGVLMSGVLAHYYAENVAIKSGSDDRRLEYFLPFPLVLFIEIAYLALLYIVFIYYYKKDKVKGAFTYLTFIETVAVGVFLTLGHGYTHPIYNNGGLDNNKVMYQTVKRVNDNDKTFFRMNTTLNVKSQSDNNQNMNNYNSASTFHTLYNFNTKEFKFWSNLSEGTNGWSASYMEKRQNLDQFLGFKYYLVENHSLKQDKITSPKYKINVPFGYEKSEALSDENYTVFKNDNVNKLGYLFDDVFVYDHKDPFYSLGSFYGGFGVLRNEALYFDKGIVNDEIYEGFSDEIKANLNKTTYPGSFYNYGYDAPDIDDGIDGINISSFAYQKQYYKVENSINYDINKLGDIDKDYTPMTPEEIEKTQNDKSGNVFIIIDKKDGSPLNSVPTAFYIHATYMLNYKSDIYMLDKDGNIITFDNHLDDRGPSTTYDTKNIRGFYVDEPVSKIVIYPRYYGWGEYSIVNETKANIENRFNNMESLQNVEYVDSNTFTFTTDLDKMKMAVTNIAYEEGWKVIAKDSKGDEKELDTFIVDGGFVGFMAPKGKYSYVMKYKNPHFNFAEKITAISYSIVLATYCGYVFISLDRQRKRSLNEISFRF